MAERQEIAADEGDVKASVVYKPVLSSYLYYIFDGVPIIFGIFVLMKSEERVWWIASGIICIVLGLWQILVTRAVLSTYIEVSADDVALIGKYPLALRWQDIIEAIIRQRPSIFQPWRCDRVVVLKGKNGLVLPLNTSVGIVTSSRDARIRYGCSRLFRRRWRRCSIG